MSKQNTSSAVMQQRHAGRDEYDYYPTPPWGTRALCDFLESHCYKRGGALKTQSVWEPACGEGFMARPLSEYFGNVHATDIQDFSASFTEQDGLEDFLLEWEAPDASVDWVITNPPFVQGEAFVHRALKVATKGVAMLVRIAFLETIDRYLNLLAPHPPAVVLIFVERLPINKGKCTKDAGTATSYVWLIWNNEDVANISTPSEVHYIPPGTRAKFERDGDYPDWAKEKAPAPLFDGAGL